MGRGARMTICERISRPPAPFHATPHGWAGPNLLATILFEKNRQHLPLNRQTDRYAREGTDLSLSALADQVRACVVALKPLRDLIEAHVLAAERLHGDDTPMPALANPTQIRGRRRAYAGPPRSSPVRIRKRFRPKVNLTKQFCVSRTTPCTTFGAILHSQMDVRMSSLHCCPHPPLHDIARNHGMTPPRSGNK